MTKNPLLLLKLLVATALCALGGLWISNLAIPLNGTHQWRQSDTLITAYFYCTEDSNFALPKVAARDGTSGVAVGEFPVFSYLTGTVCRSLGFWSEVTPKILNLLFLAGAFFFWGAFVRRRWGGQENDWLFWSLAFLLTPLHLNFLTIPMPEATALFFFGLAAWMWRAPNLEKRPGLDLAASMIFILAFMIRPYHVWLLFMLAPSWRRMVPIFFVCLAGFWTWYRWWPTQATTLPGYFGIGFESPSALIAAIPAMLRSIPDRIFDQTALIGLIPLAIGARFAPLWALGFLASWGSMMVLKPTHLPAHAYYLMSAGLFASVLMFLGWRRMKPKNATILGGLFVLASVANVQHSFRRDAKWLQIQGILEEAHKTDPRDQVVTYTGSNPKWLYYLKRQGTRRAPEDWNGPGSCPAGMKYFLRERSDGAPEFGPCENAL